MATYTILEQSESENTATMCIEFAVPAGNNAAGVTWQSVVSQIRTADGEAGSTLNTTKVGNGAYIATLDSGAVKEILYTHEYDRYLTDGQKATALDAAVVAHIAEYTNDFSARHNFYGMERTV